MPDGGRGPAVTLIQREVELPPYRFYEQRSGGGTPVVLIHGLGGSADWWRRNFDALAREHLVSAVDLVGFGRNRFFVRRSSLPPSFGQMAVLMTRWIESSFDSPVHLVGNSMGGHIAIHVAALRPDLVRSLTLVNSTGIPFELAPGAHIANFIVPRGAFSFGRILARDALRSGPTAIAVAFGRLLRDDARELMKDLRLPVLIMWGEHDPLVPLKYGRQIAGIIPGAKLVVVPAAGHIPMWESAELFNRELLAFFREVDGSLPALTTAGSRTFSWGLSGWTNGMAHRQSGSRREVILIHGLGMSSAYFQPLAHSLFERGVHSAAPDLPGFGDSVDAPAAGPEEHALILAAWADAQGIRNAVWAGHSIGCNAVVALAQMRPDLCRRAVYIGPLWTLRRHRILRLFGLLVLDALREPALLFRYVLVAYWRTGVRRWWKTFRRYFHDIRSSPPEGLMIAGNRDPIPDRDFVRDLIEVTGAHACQFSDPDGVAEAMMSDLSSRL